MSADFGDAVRRIRRALTDVGADHFDIIDTALADIVFAVNARVSELLAANTAGVERPREVEAALRDLLAAADEVAGRCGLPAELFRPRAHAREVLGDA